MPNSGRPSVNIWGPTPEGMQSGEIVAKDVTLPNAQLIAQAPDLLKVVHATWHVLGVMIAINKEPELATDERVNAVFKTIDAVFAAAHQVLTQAAAVSPNVTPPGAQDPKDAEAE